MLYQGVQRRMILVFNSFGSITQTFPCIMQRFLKGVKIAYFQIIYFYSFLIFAQNMDCGYTFDPPQ